MEDFCGSTFWDTELSWNTEKSKVTPDLTPCFQNTVLIWIPCAFLWIFTFFNFCTLYFSRIFSHRRKTLSNERIIRKSSSYLRVVRLTSTSTTTTTKNKFDNIPWNAFNVTKVVICLVLIITQLIRQGTTLHLKLSNFLVYPVDVYTPILRICTYALALVLIVISKEKRTLSSIIQFTFWLLLTLCQMFKFRTMILIATGNASNAFDIEADSQVMTILLELIDYPFIVGQFILQCWADFGWNQNDPEVKTECPQYSASVLNQLFFSWFDSLALKGHQKSLETKDLWSLNSEDKSKHVTAIFDENWDRRMSKLVKSNQLQCSGSEVGVLSVIVASFGSTFLAGSVLKLIPDLLAFASPQILDVLITFMSSDEDNWKGYLYATLLFLAAFISTLASGHHNQFMFVTGMRVKSALTSVLYRKSLTISNSSRKETTSGEIVNLMSVDVENVVAVFPYINRIWSSPLTIALSLYFLWGIVGPSVLAGVGVMILLIPINAFLIKLLRSYQIKQMASKDQRVKLITEILAGIKIIKLYAWEPSFQDEVMKIRQKEIKTLNDSAYLSACDDFLWTCSQFLVAIATFATYVLVDEQNLLDAQKVFVSLSLLNVMNGPLTSLPMVISKCTQAAVSLSRLGKFLNAEEIDTDAISHDETEAHPIVIEGGNFSWDKNKNSGETTGNRTLKNIHLKVQPGSLVAIVGPVGSGKSSLLSAILGELEKTSGRVNTKGSISYVAQQAWIQNGSFRENILFGKQYEARRYSKVIDACALGPDLDIFPGGDRIEIGEKGINLSGGQKQRVSIARAVYNNSDLYLLDDPLSAVDSHVGKHIFQKVLSSKGLLGLKTRILVTNSLHFLHQVDSIVVMKNGEISQSGTYEELMARKGEFSELINQYRNELEADAEDDILESTEQLNKHSSNFHIEALDKLDFKADNCRYGGRRASRENSNVEEVEKLIADETMETTSVKLSIYSDYFRAAGWQRVIPAILVYLLYQGFAIGSNFWLTVWSNEPIVNGTQGNRDLYLAVYAGLGIAQSVTFMIATALICLAVVRSSSVFHMNMLARILRAPMSFFDTTPTGRIVNRFSKDVNVLDNTLSYLMRSWLGMLTNVLGTLCVIIYCTPIFFTVTLPLGLFYFFVQKFYIPTSRQLKRLESVTRSPIYSHFSETINGASTIRAYGEQHRFIEESEDKLDTNQECYFPSLVSNRWLAIRLEAAGSFIIFFAALFAVFNRGSLNPGLAALSITYALQITYCLGFLVRSMCDVETNIVAVERLKEYGEIPQEAPWKSDMRQPPKSWPAKGSIQFTNYQTRYRDGTDLVLKNISFNIQPGEKIGIVGRTGAGKSSLTLALFRIIEGVNEGSITVDGEDIRKLGLHDVRSRLTIIPQDPVLFSGTLRFNLDPFVKYSDSAVWRALELSNLKTFVEGLEGELQFTVSEGGDNLSVGQKQLVCLARALLRKSKILVLDEATAAMDVETDDLIQKTIQSEFKDSTVITIAHRLNTIMDSTRVMVIANGALTEFDSPSKLLENTESQFYEMADDAGLVPFWDAEL